MRKARKVGVAAVGTRSVGRNGGGCLGSYKISLSKFRRQFESVRNKRKPAKRRRRGAARGGNRGHTWAHQDPRRRAAQAGLFPRPLAKDNHAFCFGFNLYCHLFSFFSLYCHAFCFFLFTVTFSASFLFTVMLVLLLFSLLSRFFGFFSLYCHAF